MKNIFKNCQLSRSAVGFTLAEVLITLGIIGIVAAVTIPNLVHKYQAKVLEIQFKKSVSVLNQIISKTRYEIGTDKLGKYCLSYSNVEKDYINKKECITKISENIIFFNTTKKSANYSTTYGVDRREETIITYNNKNKLTPAASANQLYGIYYTNRVSDGSYIGFVINGGLASLVVDINGNKKPNRLGFDIFVFKINPANDQLVAESTPNITDEIADQKYGDDYTGLSKSYYYATYGNPCNLESEREANGVGCAYYALQNKCPYDDTKTYWECLPR